MKIKNILGLSVLFLLVILKFSESSLIEKSLEESKSDLNLKYNNEYHSRHSSYKYSKHSVHTYRKTPKKGERKCVCHKVYSEDKLEKIAKSLILSKIDYFRIKKNFYRRKYNYMKNKKIKNKKKLMKKIKSQEKSFTGILKKLEKKMFEFKSLLTKKRKINFLRIYITKSIDQKNTLIKKLHKKLTKLANKESKKFRRQRDVCLHKIHKSLDRIKELKKALSVVFRNTEFGFKKAYKKENQLKKEMIINFRENINQSIQRNQLVLAKIKEEELKLEKTANTKGKKELLKKLENKKEKVLSTIKERKKLLKKEHKLLETTIKKVSKFYHSIIVETIANLKKSIAKNENELKSQTKKSDILAMKLRKSELQKRLSRYQNQEKEYSWPVVRSKVYQIYKRVNKREKKLARIALKKTETQKEKSSSRNSDSSQHSKNNNNNEKGKKQRKILIVQSAISKTILSQTDKRVHPRIVKKLTHDKLLNHFQKQIQRHKHTIIGNLKKLGMRLDNSKGFSTQLKKLKQKLQNNLDNVKKETKKALKVVKKGDANNKKEKLAKLKMKKSEKKLLINETIHSIVEFVKITKGYQKIVQLKLKQLSFSSDS